MWRESLILSWWHFVECCIFQELKNNASPGSNPFLSLNLSFKLLQQQQSVDMRASLYLWKRSTRLPVSLFDCLLVNQYGIALSLVSLSVCSSVSLSVCLSVCCLSFCSSVGLSVNHYTSLSVRLFDCLLIFVFLSVHLAVYFSASLSVSLFAYLPVCPSFSLSVCLSVRLIICFMSLFFCLSFCLSVRLSPYLIVSLSFCLSTSLSVCLFAWVFVCVLICWSLSLCLSAGLSFCLFIFLSLPNCLPVLPLRLLGCLFINISTLLLLLLLLLLSLLSLRWHSCFQQLDCCFVHDPCKFIENILTCIANNLVQCVQLWHSLPKCQWKWDQIHSAVFGAHNHLKPEQPGG